MGILRGWGIQSADILRGWDILSVGPDRTGHHPEMVGYQCLGVLRGQGIQPVGILREQSILSSQGTQPAGIQK